MTAQVPSDRMSHSFHVVYTNGSKIDECIIRAFDFEAAEKEFERTHPDATWWEIGIPIEYLRVH
jgi:hypothetical protein